MKKLYLIFIISSQLLIAQETSSFQPGEWLEFKLSYSGWLKAGSATLEVFDAVYKTTPVYKVVAKGWTTGPLRWVFEVKDHYESHFDKKTGLPYKFVRNINEGGYTKNRIVEFDHTQNNAFVNDIKEKSTATIKIEKDIQDLVSAYYYLRNNYQTDSLKKGDVVNIDITVIKDGYHGDTSRMFYVGEPSIQAKRLCEITYQSMWLGIKEVKPGAHLGDIGHAIQTYAESNGYSVVREFCGHGIGLVFHEEPQVLHYGQIGSGIELKPGMIFTIEPMINAGKRDIKMLPDGWTVVTKDRSLSAQWEHTILVTESSYEVLTVSQGTPKPFVID